LNIDYYLLLRRNEDNCNFYLSRSVPGAVVKSSH
jgi:hypothetical protein